MTANPYAPPTTDVAEGGWPPEKSFARRFAFVLAAFGFVGYWGAGVALAVATLPPLWGGVVILLAMAAHTVGVAISFAAPRGRRLAPVLVNAISLAIQIAVMIFGLTMGAEL